MRSIFLNLKKILMIQSLFYRGGGLTQNMTII
jgi:hypothetical protein